MAARATFTGFESCKLTGVTMTDRELGHGSYATVLQLDYMGLKCAGKKIHEVLLRQGDTSYTVRRFEEECRLLSQVRHPNIVQFLGVHFQEGVPAPILVMEFLPINLTSCIEQYGSLPNEISYSILHDVALGLCYLHRQTPSIIHRDLSSNNVLLASNMTAKISDLGVARILNLTPLQVSRMTQTPGTPAYMPPEVMIANPKYDTSVDQFSYGIMMIHMFSGRWPEPQVGQTRFEDDQLIPVTEAERREVFLEAIGNDHPLMDLILKCINNDPRRRADASEIVERLSAMKLQFPSFFANRLEMLRQIEQQEEEKRALRDEGKAERQRNEQQISSLRKKVEEKGYENIRLTLVYSSDMEQLKLQLQDSNSQKQVKEEMIQLKETHLELLSSRIAVKNEKIKQLKEAYSFELKKVEIDLADRLNAVTLGNEVNEAHRKELETKFSMCEEEMKIWQEKSIRYAERLKKEKQQHIEVKRDNLRLESELKSLLESKFPASEAMNEVTILKLTSEVDSQARALKVKNATISGMNEQIDTLRHCLLSDQKPLQISVFWKQCADLPVEVIEGRSCVMNGKIYCEGAVSSECSGKGESTIYCCSVNGDKWTTLPPLPVREFSLGHINNHLVAIGGCTKKLKSTDMIYTYSEITQDWIQEIPPMPTARHSPGVLSLQSALLVAGGDTGSEQTDAVEVYSQETLQWYRTEPLLMKCRCMSLFAIDDICYVIGGFQYPSILNTAFYASIDDILHTAVPAYQRQPHHSEDSNNQPIWKMLPNTPTYLYGQVATALVDNLVTVGGEKTSDGEGNVTAVHMYFPSINKWLSIGDLPTSQSRATVAVLSPAEFLVIGGFGDDSRAVYKGTLYMEL